jgi:hypothetical protein
MSLPMLRDNKIYTMMMRAPPLSPDLKSKIAATPPLLFTCIGGNSTATTTGHALRRYSDI